MNKSNLNENNFETSHVTKTLVDNGYFERLPDNYNQELFLDTETLLKFIKSTQPEEWEKLCGILWGQTPKLTFRKRTAYAAGSGKPH